MYFQPYLRIGIKVILIECIKNKITEPHGWVINYNYFHSFKSGFSRRIHRSRQHHFFFGAKEKSWVKRAKSNIFQLTLSLFKHEIEDIYFSDKRFYLSGTLSKTKKVK